MPTPKRRFNRLSNLRLPENSPIGYSVGSVILSDEDAEDTFTCNLTQGGAGVFDIVDNVLVVAGQPLDFEGPQNEYAITVTCTDSGTPALSATAAFTVSLDDVNELPTNITLSPDIVTEPGNTIDRFIGILTVVDQDATGTNALLLADDADGRFVIRGDRLELAPGATVDFETQSQWTVGVSVLDQDGLLYTQDVLVRVRDANDAPGPPQLGGSTLSEHATNP